LRGAVTVHEYDLIAEWYASVRVDTTGVPEATALASSLPRGSRVLDIGCGNGIPLTKALLSGGHRVVSLDSSGAMLRHFRLNYPELPAVQAIVQSCPFIDRTFDAAVAWGILFHLNPEDQIKAIASVSRVLRPGAPFLFTSGDEDCFQGKVSTMDGVEFWHFSYSTDTYGRLLRDYGFTLTNVHADSGNNLYYLAKKG
jgi:SAM-dependent methyltransferase